MSALSQQAVRERGIRVMGLEVHGSVNFDIDGFVTRSWVFLRATCPNCGAALDGSISKIGEHFAEHAEELAMEQIRKRNAPVRFTEATS